MGLHLDLENEKSRSELSRRIQAELRRKSETGRDSDVGVFDESEATTETTDDEPVSDRRGGGRAIFILALVFVIIVGYFLVAE